MNLLRTIVACCLLLLLAAVIIAGLLRGTAYTDVVVALTPVTSLAAGYLLGRDAIEAVLDRRRQRDRS